MTETMALLSIVLPVVVAPDRQIAKTINHTMNVKLTSTQSLRSPRMTTPPPTEDIRLLFTVSRHEGRTAVIAHG